ncbi:hypothetical protein H9L39_18037 [Fusarium oxysporum f. sp. albedinis]|nr:hypothetical protein H9L39_18037 [Fusarium oxysporum f. sp. albedinis]
MAVATSGPAYKLDSIKSPLDYAHAKAAEFCSDSAAPQTTTDADPKEESSATAKTPIAVRAIFMFQQKKRDTERPDGCRLQASFSTLRIQKLQRIFTQEKTSSEDYHRMRNDGEFGWLWGRRVVSFGDSVDRRAARAVAHGCLSYPAFNLTFTAFHSAGGFTYRPDWFWYKQMRIIPFERRWEELWQPHERDIQGPNGRPDLILWQNGLWDQRGFQVGGQKLHEGQNVTVNGRYRKLVWDELHFVLARTKKYAEMIIRVSGYSYDVEKFNVSLKDWIGRYHGN